MLVPFGRQKLVGIITATDTVIDFDPSKIRNIIEVYASSADVPGPILKLCRRAANYYHYPLGEVLAAALPTQIRKGWNPEQQEYELVLTEIGASIEPDALNRAPAQKSLIALLKASPRSKAELGKADIRSTTIKNIRDKAWALWQPRDAATHEPINYNGPNTSELKVTEEQSLAVSRVLALPDKTHQTFLLDGITGSGKTEIYLQVIDRMLSQGKQALVLVPEIGLTPQTIARFSHRFDVNIVVLHSGLSDRERALGWFEALNGGASIILGTRSAIFTPLKHPGVIIVDEEHDASYKQQDGFRYSARDLAVLRAQDEDIPVILGSATPSLESLHNVATSKYEHLVLKDRPPGTTSESYELIDTRHLEITEGFTRGLRKRIDEHLSQGNQVLIFINRRGFAPVLLCQDCGWIAQCRRCDAKMTVHLGDSSLICHHCGTINHNLANCQSCKGSRTTPLGYGTQRIEKTLEVFFPDYPVIRIDRDSTRRKNAMTDFLDRIHQGDPALLVGTQLLAKGHHFPNVTLVALLDVDAGFYSSDFRALERLGQLTLQVGGRAGREDKPGSVLIQSEFANHPLLQKLTQEGYAPFAADLLKERADTDMPPYSFQAIIRAESADAKIAVRFLEGITSSAKPSDSVQLLGPIPALMERKAGKYRYLLILASKHRADLHKELNVRMHIAESMPDAKKVRWAIDVDPIDLF